MALPDIILSTLGGITVLTGLAFSTWSFMKTRAKYYDEFVERRKRQKK